MSAPRPERRPAREGRRGRPPQRPDRDRAPRPEQPPPPLPDSVRLELDPDLPITGRADDIRAALERSQVVVVAGETGSGKTTQLPKLCLAMGRRAIGHTQPRRIAARSVAERVAEELGTELGSVVGYQVRFTRRSSEATRLKVMTDGILLAEIGHDRMLRRYDTIIIDEAHERSLNIDFLLGFLRQLLPQRPELKVVVTSATIDTARFAEHFADADGNPAPVVEVSGRTYPVEVRYRPLRAEDRELDEDDDDPDTDAGADRFTGEERDQVDGIVEAVRELQAETDLTGGDILVFLSGEREIRDAADALTALQLPHTEILPLYARLSAAEQHRVFARHTGRRIVLSTNVAETSLTVPGIRYVIDTGTARISRWSARSKVQRLPIEPISQASANQRAGRCGRVAPGICIRLYSRADYESRPEFTEPEILRTNLASVILQMASARLGAITDFPFVEPPVSAQVADGLRLLRELGALDERRSQGGGDDVRLTRVGQRLARLPLDPRLGRMLLAAEDRGCLREVLVVVAGLSIQDPRERPAEHREAADALHRRFWTAAGALPSEDQQQGSPDEGTPSSDFLAWLHLWRYLRTRRRELSGNAFRRMCRDEFLNFLRIREWQDLHGQLREICTELGMTTNTRDAPVDQVHTALLTGLLSQIGLLEVREEGGRPRRGGGRAPMREYLGARGVRFAIAPGSVLSRRPPELVMAAELVETSRLWARTVAPVTAAQLEEVGAHLLKRQYSEPHWSERSASVVAYERVTLLGVPVVARRQVGYGRIDPEESRRMFIQAALVEGRWRTRHHFFARNAAVRAEAEQLEERARRRDIVVDDEAIAAFYDARVPADVVSGAHFDRWWREARQQQPHLLDLTLDDLVTDAAADATGGFPDTWTVAGHDLAVDYVFDPGSGRDGVTVTVPVEVLNQVDEAPFSWQVPGLRRELATELIRGLPKQLRTRFVPAPDHARRALEWLSEHQVGSDVPFPRALGQALRALTGEQVPEEAWQSRPVPEHLRVRFEVPTPDGRRQGRDLAELRRELAQTVSETLGRVSSELVQTGRTDWTFGTIPAELRLERGGHRVVGYPALTEERTPRGATVGLVVAESPHKQQQLHVRGLRRLVLLQTPDPTRWVVSHLPNTDKLALGHSPYPGVPDLLADARLASVGSLVEEVCPHPEQVREEADFRRLCDRVRADNAERMRSVVATTARLLTTHQQVLRLLAGPGLPPETRDDVTEQVGNLVFPGFLAVTGYGWLQQLPRYLAAAEQRLRSAATDPARDRRLGAEVVGVEDAYAELVAEQPPGPLPPAVEEIGWQVEELRVSLFAQTLGTRGTVSRKRVLRAIEAARRG
ncbi:ATP-dependent RNA helicase HrpA [Auraticoccus sp. F435]|uniref:ATP-dependent RNA helicase HrpA n=1 Tax=Auraticoccus cholistanensis TaxID=2656650 RepID=A0A6A9USM3_9ACTN|nr:ATP-dependent RNA helicase HrpA [Auraticoccus cholistanensis]MVA75691.1 ATP-dependent RNA helicase HrpA [Auraticoccus cholistanensis]